MASYEALGASPVINASGRMTALGGSVLAPEVREAMSRAAEAYVDMDDLLRQAGARIAALCGAEDAFLTTGAAAGVVAMVAAVVAGDDPARVRALPDATWPRRDIVVQAGHLVDFGAPIEQMVRLGGGRVRAVGAVNAVPRSALEAALDGEAAAVLYVQSHHAVGRGQLPLEEVVASAHAAGVPVLVDAAAEEDLTRYVRLGADLVAYSGGKAIGGPSSGFVLGRRHLVALCRAHEHGILRPMKIGKETALALVAATERYLLRDDAAEHLAWEERLEGLRAGLSGVDGLRLAVEADEAGRAIRRLAVGVEPGAGFTLAQLVERLRRASPPIAVRSHRLAEGWIALDPRPLRPSEVDVVVGRIRAEVAYLRGATAP
ncbi:MAG: aminotransferase class V-fold PLP-dependent enzyme [Firmicutes bacterium]|nr:aminotransferase class V-fold PLP-dependent enzyme [Bacillota bacterium]